MANAHSIRTTVFVLLIFAVLYFVALGIYELKKLIARAIEKKKNKNMDEKDDE